MELSILTSDFLMWHGLQWVGYDERRQKKAQRSTNIDRFTKHYGPEPFTCAHIWEDFQTTAIPEARVDRKDLDLKYFLMALHWLYRYDSDEELSGTFDRCKKIVAKWKWFYVAKVAALKGQKVSSLPGRHY